jgi:hypothetical protein
LLHRDLLWREREGHYGNTSNSPLNGKDIPESLLLDVGHENPHNSETEAQHENIEQNQGLLNWSSELEWCNLRYSVRHQARAKV